MATYVLYHIAKKMMQNDCVCVCVCVCVRACVCEGVSVCLCVSMFSFVPLFLLIKYTLFNLYPKWNEFVLERHFFRPPTFSLTLRNYYQFNKLVRFRSLSYQLILSACLINGNSQRCVELIWIRWKTYDSCITKKK